MAAAAPPPLPLRALEGAGRAALRALAAIGFGATLLAQALAWLALGRRRGQRVRAEPVFAEMMQIGVRAIPIVSLLSATIGVMLAIQGIYQLRRFGAEDQVVLGVAFGMTREFAPLITGILVAGRSGSALAARLATMTIHQEVDALRVMGIHPVRFLVVPSLLAMLLCLPALVIWADVVSLLAAGLYVAAELGTTLEAEQVAQQRALARAAAAHDHHDLAAAHLEAHAVQDLSRAVVGHELAHLDHGVVGGVAREGLRHG